MNNATARLNRLSGPEDAHRIRLEIYSTIDLVDLVQAMSDHIARMAGFDDELMQQLSLAVRECVSNAITHGNHADPAKRVLIEFTTTPRVSPREVAILVR